MLEDQDSEFILSIFLMEAWDTVASVEDGMRRFEKGEPPSSGKVDPLVVVGHRLKGAAALHGYPVISAVALVMENLLEQLPGLPASQRADRIAALGDVVATVKRMLEMVGDDGREDVETVASLHARHPELFPSPAAPTAAHESAPLGGRSVEAATMTPPPATSSPDAEGPRPAARSPFARPPGAPPSAPRVVPSAPTASLEDITVDRMLADLERFFTEHADAVSYFGPEAAEHLDTMSRSIGALETGGSREEEVAILFRAIHTLKGAAYTVGCGPVGDVSHRIEDILEAVRGHRLELSPAIVEAVVDGVDALRVMLGAVAPDARRRLPPTLDLLDALRPAAPEPMDEAAPVVVAPAPPRFVPPRAEPRPVRPRREARPSIRVGLDRLDSLMNLVGRLVIARSRLDQRFAQIERVNELLAFSRSRMSQTVRDFEEKHRYTQLPPAMAAPGGAAEGETDVFAELEFDRYDDFNIFARSIDEISADISEIQTELAGFIRSIGEDTSHVHRLTGSLRHEVTRARMVPIGRLFARYAPAVREAARASSKTIDFQLAGETVEVDNAVIEQIADPLLHLVRNAIDHGVETDEVRRGSGKPERATIRIRAHHQGSFVHIEVADDGRGMDPALLRERAVRLGFLSAEAAAALAPREALNLIFLPGFSTAREITALSGRGVGMDVVRTNVGRLNGEIEVQSEPGAGTRIIIKLPLTVVISDALLVRSGGEIFAVPMHAIRSVVQVRPEEIARTGERERVVVEGEEVELIRLEEALALPAARPVARMPVLIVRSGVRPLAVAVEELVGKEDVVIKSLGGVVERVGPFGGATITGAGHVILLLDPSRLLEVAEGSRAIPRSS